MTYEFFTEYFYHNGIDMQPDIEVATADQMPAVLLCDLGYGFVPEVLLETHAGKDRLYEIPLYEEVPLRSICMVEDTGRTLTTAAAELKKMLLASSGPQA
jgi:DNA-binding transcriptional LysR family regulator